MTTKTYDTHCYDLAEFFLSEEPGATAADIDELAGTIQTTIEDFIMMIADRKPSSLAKTEPKEAA